MSIRDTVVMTRHNAIMDLLRESRLSIKQVADTLGVSYHTIRNDFTTLMEDGQIRSSIATGDKGERLFMAGDKRPMPVFYHGKQQSSLWDQATNFGRDPRMAAGAGAPAIFQVKSAMLQILWEARSLENGQPPTEKQLLDLRKQATDALINIELVYNVIKQFIASDVWSIGALERLPQDEQWNGELVDRIYSHYLEVLESERQADRNEQDRHTRDSEEA